MKIFYSWSGNMSKEIAAEFHDFIPLLIPGIIPFYTPKDIDKGTQWLSEILAGLNQCQAGIVFITPENYDKPWVLFEAGAIANRYDGALVYPVFFNLATSDVNNPLTKIFQATNFSKDDIWHMISNMNGKLETGRASEIHLKKHFENYYPEFEEKIIEIITKYPTTPKSEPTTVTNPVVRDNSEKIDEALDILRAIQRKQNSQVTVQVGGSPQIDLFKTNPPLSFNSNPAYTEDWQISKASQNANFQFLNTVKADQDGGSYGSQISPSQFSLKDIYPKEFKDFEKE